MESIEANEESWQEIGEGDARFVQLGGYGATEGDNSDRGVWRRTPQNYFSTGFADYPV